MATIVDDAGMGVWLSMMDAEEARRLRVTSHEAMLAERDPWPVRAAAGDTAAAVGLGTYFYHQGRRDEAERWFGQAAQSGEAEGCYSLGVLRQEDGRTAEADRLFAQAAEAGNPKAMNYLCASAQGRGDHEGALAWAGRAASAGNVTGMINFGVLLLGSGRNEEARKWFDTAARAGGPGTRQRIVEQVTRSGLTLPRAKHLAAGADAESWTGQG